MITATNVLVLLAMLVGTIGIIVPVLPGLLLVWLAFLVWAFEQASTPGWVAFGVATAVYAAGMVAQYLLPGRRMKAAGVPTWTVGVALVVAVIGLFVIPVIGAPIGFIGSIYLIEHVKHHDRARAWTATKRALRAVGLNIGIELLTALAMIATWGVTVWVSRP